MKTGDTCTIAGTYVLVPNTNRRWWQFWKPKMVPGSELAVFAVRKVVKG